MVKNVGSVELQNGTENKLCLNWNTLMEIHKTIQKKIFPYCVQIVTHKHQHTKIETKVTVDIIGVHVIKKEKVISPLSIAGDAADL